MGTSNIGAKVSRFGGFEEVYALDFFTLRRLHDESGAGGGKGLGSCSMDGGLHDEIRAAGGRG